MEMRVPGSTRWLGGCLSPTTPPGATSMPLPAAPWGGEQWGSALPIGGRVLLAGAAVCSGGHGASLALREAPERRPQHCGCALPAPSQSPGTRGVGGGLPATPPCLCAQAGRPSPCGLLLELALGWHLPQPEAWHVGVGGAAARRGSPPSPGPRDTAQPRTAVSTGKQGRQPHCSREFLPPSLLLPPLSLASGDQPRSVRCALGLRRGETAPACQCVTPGHAASAAGPGKLRHAPSVTTEQHDHPEPTTSSDHGITASPPLTTAPLAGSLAVSPAPYHSHRCPRSPWLCAPRGGRSRVAA